MKYVCKGQPGQRHPISQLPPPLSAQDKNGKATDWGNVPYSKVYGPQGWCEADNPVGEGRCDHWGGGERSGAACWVSARRTTRWGREGAIASAPLALQERFQV